MVQTKTVWNKTSLAVYLFSLSIKQLRKTCHEEHKHKNYIPAICSVLETTLGNMLASFILEKHLLPPNKFVNLQLHSEKCWLTYYAWDTS